MKLFNWLNSSNKFEVGKNPTWREFIGQVTRIVEFDRNKTHINQNGSVIAKSVFKPYGYLIVESPVYEKNLRLPIVHQDDYLLAASIYDDTAFANLIKEYEVLVTYIPKEINQSGSIGFHHGLHYVITYKNALEKYYELKDTENIDLLEDLFISFDWEGELKVQLNLNNPLFK